MFKCLFVFFGSIITAGHGLINYTVSRHETEQFLPLFFCVASVVNHSSGLISEEIEKQ